VNINLTLFGQMVTFAFFVWFCMKFVWPVIITAMEERQKKIADGLDAADRALRDLEVAQNKASDQMKEAKQEAASIIDQANKRAIAPKKSCVPTWQGWLSLVRKKCSKHQLTRNLIARWWINWQHSCNRGLTWQN
jgi:hypothetical protein